MSRSLPRTQPREAQNLGHSRPEGLASVPGILLAHVWAMHRAQEADSMSRARAGARFSWTDGIVLGVAGAIALALWRVPTNPGVIVLTVVGHFFLFCNVVRLRRSFELMWAGSYVAATFGLVGLGSLDWRLAALATTPVTVALIVLEVRSERYHGIGWRRVNPGLGR